MADNVATTPAPVEPGSSGPAGAGANPSSIREDGPSRSGLPFRARRRWSLLTRRDKIILALIVGIPLVLDLALIWGSLVVDLLWSLTDWRGVGDLTGGGLGHRFIGLQNYTQLFDGTYPFTIKEYNAAVKADVPFNPNVKDGRGTTGLAINKSNWANIIDTPPFEGYAVTCGVTFTFGGLRINTDGEVLNTDYQPIPGLYAAGELVGGLFYFNYPGGSGLMSGTVFGKIAGTSAGRAGKN
jgi:hypothetical protein